MNNFVSEAKLPAIKNEQTRLPQLFSLQEEQPPVRTMVGRMDGWMDGQGEESAVYFAF